MSGNTDLHEATAAYIAALERIVGDALGEIDSMIDRGEVKAERVEMRRKYYEFLHEQLDKAEDAYEAARKR